MSRESPTTDQQWRAVLTLIEEPAVVAYTEKQLRTLALSGGFEAADLRHSVLVRIRRRLAGGEPIGDGEPDAVRRYLYRTIRYTALDLLRAEQRQRLVPRDGERTLVALDDPTCSTDPSTPDPNDRIDVDWDRLRVLAADPPPRQKRWLTAAVLGYLTVSENEEDGLPGRLRLPEEPAPGQVAEWVALQYAGRNDCFVEPETSTVRKRRSDAGRRLRDAMKPIVAKGLDRVDQVAAGGP